MFMSTLTEDWLSCKLLVPRHLGVKLPTTPAPPSPRRPTTFGHRGLQKTPLKSGTQRPSGRSPKITAFLGDKAPSDPPPNRHRRLSMNNCVNTGTSTTRENSTVFCTDPQPEAGKRNSFHNLLQDLGLGHEEHRRHPPQRGASIYTPPWLGGVPPPPRETHETPWAGEVRTGRTGDFRSSASSCTLQPGKILVDPTGWPENPSLRKRLPGTH